MNIVESYRLLELPTTANLHEVKASYRRLARQWHPDVNPGNHQAHEMFIRVTQAYKVLLKVVPPVPNSAAVSPPPQPQSPNPTSRPVKPPSPNVKVSVRKTEAQSQAQSVKPDSSGVKPPPTVKVSVDRTNTQSPPSASPQRPSPRTSAQPGQSGTPGQPASSNQSRQRTNHSSSPSSSLANQKLKYDSYRQLQNLIKHKRFPRAIALVEALRQRLPQDLEVRQWQAIIYQSWGRQLIRERRLEQARAYLKKALNTDPHNRSLWAEVERDFQTLEKIF